MRFEELEAICQEAAREIAGREPRPLPAAVVLPLAKATRITTFPEFPDDDEARAQLLEQFADDVMRPENAPCYGFLAEASVDAGGEATDAIVVVYGARGHHPRITAAAWGEGELGAFATAEPLASEAMPFIAVLQRTVDAAEPPDVFSAASNGS